MKSHTSKETLFLTTLFLTGVDSSKILTLGRSCVEGVPSTDKSEGVVVFRSQSDHVITDGSLLSGGCPHTPSIHSSGTESL